MALPVFPYSPLPATMVRSKSWNDDMIMYDSGEAQGFSNWIRPLFRWSFPFKLLLPAQQSSLWAFWDDRRGRTRPFLMKDPNPQDSWVNSVLAVRSGITNAATLYLYDTNSYMVRADTTTIGSLLSTLSGFVNLGTHYSYDQDSGILTVNTKAANDVWSGRSFSYYRKCRFAAPYNEQQVIWGVFAVDNVSIIELP